MNTILRIQAADNSWIPLDVVAKFGDGGCEVTVLRGPRGRGHWLISSGGMVANIGGNDPWIYTLHPEDCERICAAVQKGVSP